jgi:glycosyltransferase involved in cell wall biosynthesis
MVIAIVPEWFSEKMGYVENHLPKSFVKLGCQVHVITSELQVYGTDPNTYSLYEPFLGPAVQPVGTKKLDGFALHRLSHYKTQYGIGFKGLVEKLQEIKPDIVYLFEINTEHTLQVVYYKSIFNYKIFTESRLHLSVYRPPETFLSRLKHFITERKKWKNVGKGFEKCYPIAPDVLHVITKYLGQDIKKCELASLAVDINLFKPIESVEESRRREEIRKGFGFKETDVICIYTGRFTDGKGPVILAKAIQHLHQQGKLHFKGLFVGTGSKEYELEITSKDGCFMHPFVQSNELVNYYQAADIGVWPKQESTSQLDAAACGLPLIISSAVEDIDRIKGNGYSYHHEDSEDLAKQIEKLESSDVRKKMGDIGVEKIRKLYSWDYVAEQRYKDFKKALKN